MIKNDNQIFLCRIQQGGWTPFVSGEHQLHSTASFFFCWGHHLYFTVDVDSIWIGGGKCKLAERKEVRLLVCRAGWCPQEKKVAGCDCVVVAFPNSNKVSNRPTKVRPHRKRSRRFGAGQQPKYTIAENQVTARRRATAADRPRYHLETIQQTVFLTAVFYFPFRPPGLQSFTLTMVGNRNPPRRIARASRLLSQNASFK